MRPPSLPSSTWRCASIALLLGSLIPVVTVPSVVAAETAARAFDLPAESGDKALKRFIAQSGVEVVYGSATVAAVTTNAVKGDFAPREAISRMLKGTGLIIVANERTGALTVSRDPNEQGPAAATAVNHSGNVEIHGRVQNVVTGQYLNNARVSVRGTDLVAFTDQTGTYHLTVPGGAIVLDVFYTDLDAQALTIEPGDRRSVEQDVTLTSVARYGSDTERVKLNPFLVSSDKETDAQAIATNEQRFAPNIKNVMSTDSLGEVMGSSVGEFLKFIPGVSATYDNASIVGISIRGIGGAMTSFSSDGAPMVSLTTSATRSFDTNSMALNDISRIEVTKVPLPSTRADSLGGSVNFIPKSAFERSEAQLRYGISFVGNGENITLHKTPRAYDDRKVLKINPGVDFDYTLPLSKNFGIVITGLTINRYNEQHISQLTYNPAGTSTGASISKPYLQSDLLADDPRNEERSTLSLKADWRVTRHSVLSFSAQWTKLQHSIGNDRLTTDVGTTGTSTVAGGVPMSFGNDFVIGATGRGAATLSATSQRYEQRTGLGKVVYRFDDGIWKIDSSLSRSASQTLRRSLEWGHFYSLNASLRNPARIKFSGINPDYVGKVEAFDNSNQPVDLTDINNYYVTTATDIPLNNRADLEAANLDLRRRIEAFSFPTALQVGGAVRSQSIDTQTYTRTWTYNGPDGNPSTQDSAVPYLMKAFVGQDPGYGFGNNIPFLSARTAYSAYLANPTLFTQTPAQLVAQEANRLTNSGYFLETVSAGYVQAEAGLFSNRLKIVTGVRYEKTRDRGEGQLFDPNAVYVRNANGTFAKTPAGALVRKPEAGAVGSMEELQLLRKERAYKNIKIYDGYYPSLNLTYDIRENFLVRAAYAKTYGRPDYTDIIPNTTISQADLTEAQLDDPNIVKGTITVKNSALKPWTADNYDLSFEYYTQQGGLLSAGIFAKEIKDFFGAVVKVANAADIATLGLEPQYVGWNLSTKFNVGDAEITGGEINVRQSLRMLGQWGGYFTVFANYTHLNLHGSQQASFTDFLPESGNWGASFSRKRVKLVARWNYRGLNKGAAVPTFGTDAFAYIKGRTTLDLSASYQLTRRLSLNASVINVSDVPQIALRYGSQTPDYAKEFNTRHFGAQFSVGVKGTF